MQRYDRIRRILVLALAANLAVAGLKITVGKSVGSASMAADGFHSLADAASSVLGLIGIGLAARPADRDHPYGHRKYETLASAGIAALLFFAAQDVLFDAVQRLGAPHQVEAKWYTFMVMAVTLAINLAVTRYERLAGRHLGSDFLVADSRHTLSDVYASLGVVATLVAVRLGYPVVDLVASIGIAVLIAYAGYEILKEASMVLCDRAVIEPEAVERAVLAVEGVKSCHAVRSRGRLGDVALDLHLQVEGNITLDEAHALSHAVAARLKERFPEVSDVLVHVEPVKRRQPASRDGTAASGANEGQQVRKQVRKKEG